MNWVVSYVRLIGSSVRPSMRLDLNYISLAEVHKLSNALLSHGILKVQVQFV